MNFVAIVAARAGSVRLPGKALLPFGSSTLIGHRIDTLRACPAVSRVLVNSDGPDIVAEAVRHGAEAMTGRDYHGCTRTMLLDSARQCPVGSVVLWAHPTNPLVSAATYGRAVEAYREGLAHGHDSLLSVYRVQRHAWFDGRPLNYDPGALRHTLAADCRPVWFQDGAMFVQSRERWLRTAYWFGDRPVLFETPSGEVADVDHLSDLDDARRRFVAGSVACQAV